MHCSVPSAFSWGLQVFGTYLPCYTKLEHCWQCGRSSLFCRGTDGRCLFSGGLHSPWEPTAWGHQCLVTHPLGLILGLPDHFYIILCPVPATTQQNDSFRTWWFCWSWTIKWRSISYGCSLWVFMAGQMICLPLQHLMEVAAIISYVRDLPYFPRVKIKSSHGKVFWVASSI